MPFKNEAQRKACWAQYNRDKKANKKPKWDCKKWEKETQKVVYDGKRRIVRTGPRGGKYIITSNGTKRYI